MASSVRFRSQMKMGRNGAIGLVPLCQFASFNPSAASAATGIVIPAGGRVLRVDFNAAGTGGTTPTFDVGTAGNGALFVNEADADGGEGSTFSLDQTVLTADTPVFAGVGASAATGGTVTIVVWYLVDPDNANYLDPSRE